MIDEKKVMFITGDVSSELYETMMSHYEDPDEMNLKSINFAEETQKSL